MSNSDTQKLVHGKATSIPTITVFRQVAQSGHLTVEMMIRNYELLQRELSAAKKELEEANVGLANVIQDLQKADAKLAASEADKKELVEALDLALEKHRGMGAYEYKGIAEYKRLQSILAKHKESK